MAEAINSILDLSKGDDPKRIAQEIIGAPRPDKRAQNVALTEHIVSLGDAVEAGLAARRAKAAELATQSDPQFEAARQQRLAGFATQTRTEEFTEAAKTAFRTNLTSSAWKALTQNRPEFQVDPNFDWAAVRLDVVAKYGPEHIDKLSSARSAAELKSMTDSLDQQQKDEAVMGRSVFGTATGHLADPLVLLIVFVVTAACAGRAVQAFKSSSRNLSIWFNIRGKQPGVALWGAGLLAFMAFGIAQLVAGFAGIAHGIGWFWAGIAVILALWLRFTLPITIGAFFGALYVWEWHWVAAALFAAPGLLLAIPGVFAALIVAYGTQNARRRDGS